MKLRNLLAIAKNLAAIDLYQMGYTNFDKYQLNSNENCGDQLPLEVLFRLNRLAYGPRTQSKDADMFEDD